MKAAVGDWLLVNSHAAELRARRAQILGIGADGAPPYTVRWVDEDRTVIVFPGPDAEIVTSQRLAELDWGEGDVEVARPKLILRACNRHRPTALSASSQQSGGCYPAMSSLVQSINDTMFEAIDPDVIVRRDRKRQTHSRGRRLGKRTGSNPDTHAPGVLQRTAAPVSGRR